jgi:hypothetical protein
MSNISDSQSMCAYCGQWTGPARKNGGRRHHVNIIFLPKSLAPVFEGLASQVRQLIYHSHGFPKQLSAAMVILFSSCLLICFLHLRTQQTQGFVPAVAAWTLRSGRGARVRFLNNTFEFLLPLKRSTPKPQIRDFSMCL